MVKKSTKKAKTTSRKNSNKSSKKIAKKSLTKNKKEKSHSEIKREQEQKYPTLKLKTEHDIASDFAVKTYKEFDKLVKAIILFGSTAKQESVIGSDIDIIIIIDDVSIEWTQELILWYRKELEKIIDKNPYKQSLHINTIKLSTWWKDLMRGDPIILNILRNGEELIDTAAFFKPLKYLLIKGEIRPTPEAIHSCLQRAPMHLTQSRSAELGAIEGIYWSMVDSAHAALLASGQSPPSPEHIPRDLKVVFVDKGKTKQKYIDWYREVLDLHKQISHGKITDLRGNIIDEWQDRAEEFFNEMLRLVKFYVS